MSFDGFCKRTFYWVNDWIHGKKVRKHLDEIKKVMADSETGNMIQSNSLKNLLEYATRYSDFYKSYKGKQLKEFPIVNKTKLMENYESIVVPVSNIPEQESENVHIQKTSGSTGTPFAIYQDSRKRHRRVAELKYFGEMVGFKSHERLAQCRIWTNWQSKTKSQSFKENIFPINVSKMDDETLSELCSTVAKNKIVAIRAYASWYDNLLEYFLSGKGDITLLKTIKVMFSTSEALNVVTKEQFMKKWNIPIVECYADEEAGIMAHQFVDNNIFHLNHASYIFEILKLDSDEPAKYGEIGRIVITDLYNYAFPLIRYDTGDTAILQKGNEKTNGWDYFEKLYGRRLDLIYDTKGNPTHPMSFARILKNLPGISQWQFIQKDKLVYELRINPKEDFDEERTLSEVLSVIGKDADLTIKYVDEIPVLASGKRKPVICEWKRN
ncbi:MAG: hypothetical protein NC485_02485 [Ruminococcus flavefaciens]|nr:hypothetical protein [Ruminococcus flavefaciens]MCM1060036.1 hypothetical protein [Eubacterium sp.]